ncbi:hypothetical protein H0E87_023335, partial [Populus deltoides]
MPSCSSSQFLHPRQKLVMAGISASISTKWSFQERCCIPDGGYNELGRRGTAPVTQISAPVANQRH